ncbi:MAG: Hsp20/alpha crystallin family protein [Armatimonadota bacterium]|nr:Hsp20/alpha crystallin family protein [bacterium]
MPREKILARRAPTDLETIEPWNTFRDMERMFRGFFGVPMVRAPRMWTRELSEYTPEVDLRETDKELVLSATVPGMGKEDIDIDVTGDTITISGERKTEEEKPGERYHFRQQSYGSFCLSYSLPMEVKPEEVKAHYKNGVLEIMMPKAEESAKHKVTVEETE